MTSTPRTPAPDDAASSGAPPEPGTPTGPAPGPAPGPVPRPAHAPAPAKVPGPAPVRTPPTPVQTPGQRSRPPSGRTPGRPPGPTTGRTQEPPSDTRAERASSDAGTDTCAVRSGPSYGSGSGPGPSSGPEAGARAEARTDAPIPTGTGTDIPTGTGTDPGTETAEELAAYLATHPAPAAAVDALIRDERGRLLVVDPVYKPGWDLPGGMVDDEGLVDGLVRELREELRPARLRVGRLLAVDNVPAAVYGRAMTACVYAVHLPHPVRVADLHLQRDELRAAEFLPEAEALERLPERLRRRTVAALAAERGAHTAHLLDGYPAPLGDRDRWALLPGPVVAAAVLVVDRAGRVLVMEGGDRRGGQTSRHRLPGTLVAADETPREAAARTLRARPRPDGPRPDHFRLRAPGTGNPEPGTPRTRPPRIHASRLRFRPRPRRPACRRGRARRHRSRGRAARGRRGGGHPACEREVRRDGSGGCGPRGGCRRRACRGPCGAGSRRRGAAPGRGQHAVPPGRPYSPRPPVRGALPRGTAASARRALARPRRGAEAPSRPGGPSRTRCALPRRGEHSSGDRIPLRGTRRPGARGRAVTSPPGTRHPAAPCTHAPTHPYAHARRGWFVR